MMICTAKILLAARGIVGPMLPLLVSQCSHSSDASLALRLLEAVDADYAPLSAEQLVSVGGFTARLSSGASALSQACSGVALCALVTCASLRLATSCAPAGDVMGGGGGGGGLAAAAEGPSARALTGEEAKEVGNLLIRLCGEAAVRAASCLVRAERSWGCSGAEVGAVCLPKLYGAQPAPFGGFKQVKSC
jgi:hypothetical protein